MVKLFLFGLFAFLFSSPELVLYTNDNYSFEVQLPSGYKEENLTQAEKFGTLESIRLSGREGSAGYTVVATRYKSSEAFKKSGKNFQEVVANYAKQQSEESFVKNNFIILGEHHTKNVLEYVVAEAETDMGMIRRIYIRKEMTYSLSIYCDKDFIRQENVEPFFKSLKFKAIKP